MKYLIPILLLALTLGAGDCQNNGGGNTLCNTTGDVTIQFVDQCTDTPVILDQFTFAYPDGSKVDIRPTFGDPPGVYRIPQVPYCQECLTSVTADGYISYIDTAVKFYTDYSSASMTPIGGCPIP